MPTTVQVSYYTVTVSKSRMFEPYIIGYDESVFPPVAIYQDDVVIPTTTLSGDADSYTATGLEPDTAYYFLLTACNRAGCQSTIYGPVITHRVLTPESATFTANARYNPLTGLVRFWWTQEVYPYLVQIVCSAPGGTKTFDVYGKLYTEEVLLSGWNTITIQQFTEDGTGTSPCRFTLYVPPSSIIGTPQEVLEIQESVSSVNQSVDARAVDVLVFQDLTIISADAPQTITITDPLFIDETVVAGGLFITCDVSSSLAFYDTVEVPVNGFVYVRVEDEVQLYDTVSSGGSSTITLTINEQYLLSDTASVRVSMEPAVLVETLCFIEVEQPRDPYSATVTDTVNFMDTIISLDSVTSINDETVNLVDLVHTPEINTSATTETITTFDTPYGFRVGDTYDFTHVQGE